MEKFKYFNFNQNDIILDFFAGSGTTGDAVMQLNAEEGGNRKFILVQWDEAIKRRTEAYRFCKANEMEPVISSITIERLNRAGEKIKEEANPNLFNGDATLDIGYKVFSLTEKPKLAQNEEGLFAIANERKDTLNTLCNLLCGTCQPLHTKIKEVQKDKLYLVESEGETYLYVLGEVSAEVLKGYGEVKIFIDGWADIGLENWLNLGLHEKDQETTSVIY